MPKKRSQDLFIEAKSFCHEKLDTLASEHGKALFELQEVQRLINESKKGAKKIATANQRSQLEKDLYSLASYKKELKTKLKDIASQIKNRVVPLESILAFE